MKIAAVVDNFQSDGSFIFKITITEKIIIVYNYAIVCAKKMHIIMTVSFK
jgi:hypothetical protein